MEGQSEREIEREREREADRQTVVNVEKTLLNICVLFPLQIAKNIIIKKELKTNVTAT